MGFFDFFKSEAKEGDKVIYGSIYSSNEEGTIIKMSLDGRADIKLDSGRIIWSVPGASFKKI